MRHFVHRFIAVLCLSGTVLSLMGLLPTEAAPQSAPKLNLKEAEAMALGNHPLLQAANYDAQAASQITREAKSAYYPTANGSVTGAAALSNSRIAAGYLNNPLILNRESNGVEVQQLITDFGRTSNLVGSARLGARAATAGAQQTAQDVLLAVNRAYYDVLRAEAVLKVAEETVKARQILAEQVTTLEKNKLKSMLDVSFAEVNLAQARLLLVQAENNEQASYADLATALGLANPQPFDLAEVERLGVGKSKSVGQFRVCRLLVVLCLDQQQLRLRQINLGETHVQH